MSYQPKVSRAVKKGYLYLPKNELTLGQRERLKEETTAYSRYRDENGRANFPMYYDDNPDWLGIPLHHEPAPIYAKLIDRRVLGQEVVIPFNPGYREGQEEVIVRFERYARLGKTGFVLEAKPGWGKSCVLLKMLSLLGRTSLVVVPRSTLVRQWVERIQEHTGLSLEEIGVAVDGKASWQGKKIVVGLVHTLTLDRFGPDFRNYFGVVVFDEVDRTVPPATFAQVPGLFPAKYKVACSATLDRSDGLEVIFREHLGEVYLKGGKGERMSPTILVHNFPFSSGPVFGGNQVRRRGQLISRLANNPARNQRIAFFVLALMNSDRRVLVLSERISQLVWLKQCLKRQYRIPEKDIGIFARGGGKKHKALSSQLKSERAKVHGGCKIVLASYGMFSVGTDMPDLAALIYATPQKDIRQSQGRIERVLPGKKPPLVVDIVDLSYKETKTWFTNRQQLYQREGLAVKTVGVKKK